jgi:putative flippase GtrA
MAIQMARFATVGAISTVAYVALYAVLRGIAPATVANAVALVVTTVGNTAANRRLTFGVRGRHALVRDHVAGLAALAVALLISTAALGLLQSAVRAAPRALELAVLGAANAIATIGRFVVLRWAIVTGDHATSSDARLKRIPS